jgi:class 3 adenylate cyclase
MSQTVGGEAGGAERLVVLWFTDVEGSTRHWDQYPQHMAGALRRLDVAVENAVLPLGGEIVRSRGEGDSHLSCLGDRRRRFEPPRCCSAR